MTATLPTSPTSTKAVSINSFVEADESNYTSYSCTGNGEHRILPRNADAPCSCRAYPVIVHRPSVILVRRPTTHRPSAPISDQNGCRVPLRHWERRLRASSGKGHPLPPHAGQRAPAALGTACPALSINKMQGILSGDAVANTRSMEAKVEEATGITSQKVFHMARICCSFKSSPDFRNLKKRSSVGLSQRPQRLRPEILSSEVCIPHQEKHSFTFHGRTNNSDSNFFNSSEYQGEFS